jgi:micrococcal nuclease
MTCNYGRACGYLTVDGQDVGDVLIAEHLAHLLACGKYSCPLRQP